MPIRHAKTTDDFHYTVLRYEAEEEREEVGCVENRQGNPIKRSHATTHAAVGSCSEAIHA
jgi:hypothetical protein